MLAVILRLMKKLGLNISSMPLSCNVGSGLNLGLSPPSWPATFMVIGAEKDVLKELPQASNVLSYTCPPVFSVHI